MKKNFSSLIDGFSSLLRFSYLPNKELDSKHSKLNLLRITNKICFDSNCISLPPLQSASPELTDNQLKESIDFTVNSIIKFKDKYKANICFLYIPSPGTIYSPKVLSFQKYKEGPKYKQGLIGGSENLRRSLNIRKIFKSRLLNQDIGFIDSTPYLKHEANFRYLHGLNDYKHFSYIGYKILGEYVSKNISECFINSHSNNLSGL